MNPPTEPAPALDLPREERLAAADAETRATLQALKRHRGLTDARIGTLSGMSRQRVQSILNGPTQLVPTAAEALAEAFDVPRFVLALAPNPAIEWVVANRPNPTDMPSEQVELPTNWYTDGERTLSVAA